MLRFASLGSGSEGNATLIQAGQTTVLLDCGFTLKALEQRLGCVGLSPQDISAVLVTHEHSDHSAGALKAARRFGWQLYTTHGSVPAAYGQPQDLHQAVCPNTPFMINDLTVTPVAVPHDAREPVQFVFTAGAVKFGMLTDVGMITPYMAQQYAGLNALILETNHDSQMLQKSAYPQSLKNRIAGDWGHLSNAQAAQFLSQIKHSALQGVHCAHLSKQNNAPALAQQALEAVLTDTQCAVSVLNQDEPSSWIDVH